MPPQRTAATRAARQARVARNSQPAHTTRVQPNTRSRNSRAKRTTRNSPPQRDIVDRPPSPSTPPTPPPPTEKPNVEATMARELAPSTTESIKHKQNPFKKRYLRSWEPPPSDQQPKPTLSLSASISASGSASATGSATGSGTASGNANVPRVAKKRKYPKLIVEDREGNIVPNPLNISSSVGTAAGISPPHSSVMEKKKLEQRANKDEKLNDGSHSLKEFKAVQSPCTNEGINILEEKNSPRNADTFIAPQEPSEPLPIHPFQQYASSDKNGVQLKQSHQALQGKPISPLRRSLIRLSNFPSDTPSSRVDLTMPVESSDAASQPIHLSESKVSPQSNPSPNSDPQRFQNGQNSSYPVYSHPSPVYPNHSPAKRSRHLPDTTHQQISAPALHQPHSEHQRDSGFQLHQIHHPQQMQYGHPAQQVAQVHIAHSMAPIQPSIEPSQNIHQVPRIPQIDQEHPTEHGQHKVIHEAHPVQSVQFVRQSSQHQLEPRPLFYAQPQQRKVMEEYTMGTCGSSHEPQAVQQLQIKLHPVSNLDEQPVYQAGADPGVSRAVPIERSQQENIIVHQEPRGKPNNNTPVAEEKVIQAGKRCGTVQYWRSSLQMPKLGTMPKRKKYTRSGAGEGKGRKKNVRKTPSAMDNSTAAAVAAKKAEAVPSGTNSDDVHKFWRNATKLPRNNPDRTRMKKLAEGKRKAPVAIARSPKVIKEVYVGKAGPDSWRMPIMVDESGGGEVEIEKHIDEEQFEKMQRQIEADQRMAQERMLRESSGEQWK